MTIKKLSLAPYLPYRVKLRFRMPKRNTNRISWKGKITGIIREGTEGYLQVVCKPEFVVITGPQRETFNLYDDVIVEGSIMVSKIRPDTEEVPEGEGKQIQ